MIIICQPCTHSSVSTGAYNTIYYDYSTIWSSYLIIIILTKMILLPRKNPTTTSAKQPFQLRVPIISFCFVPISTMSETPSIAEQRLYLDKAMKTLQSLIRKLPSTLPCGTKDGPLVKHFTDTDHDVEEGPYYTFNRSWECVFQSPDVKQEHIIICGKHGLDLVYAYIAHFSHIPKIEENNGLQLVALRVDSLSKMIDKLYVPLNHTLLADSQIYYSKGSEPAKSKTRSTGTGIRSNVGK